jgi:hypothetical protein
MLVPVQSSTSNLLYLPTQARGELVRIQAQMVALAQNAAVELEVATTFGPDGLANGLALRFDSLDRTTSAPVHQILWRPVFDTIRSKWGTAPTTLAQTGGKAPASAEWKTQVSWGATHWSGDGWYVVADKLGPDHPRSCSRGGRAARSIPRRSG